MREGREGGREKLGRGMSRGEGDREREEKNEVTFEWSFSKTMAVNNTGVTKVLWVVINLGMETSRSGGRREAGLNHRAKPSRLNVGLGPVDSGGHWAGQ